MKLGPKFSHHSTIKSKSVCKQVACTAEDEESTNKHKLVFEGRIKARKMNELRRLATRALNYTDEFFISFMNTNE